MWIQILLVGSLVAEVGALLIYSGVELLGISVLIIYNGALLILFTLAFLLVIPSRIRPASTHTNIWVVTLVLIVMILASSLYVSEQTIIEYHDWSSLKSIDTIKNLNFAMVDKYSRELIGVAMMLLVGILATLKILKNQ